MYHIGKFLENHTQESLYILNEMSPDIIGYVQLRPLNKDQDQHISAIYSMEQMLEFECRVYVIAIIEILT